MAITDVDTMRSTVEKVVREVKLTDVHTHIYPPCFGDLLLWGVDDLITYHYLIAETFRWIDTPYEDYWRLSTEEQSELIWRPLFVENSPVAESTRGVLTVLDKLGLKENGAQRITYQDPCRLGRHLGVYDAPRNVLRALPGVELLEMRHANRHALCCAGGTWSNCDRYSKKLQVDRLREARETAAQTLVTACPKCQVHFRCAMKDPNLQGDIEIEMRDLAELVAGALTD